MKGTHKCGDGAHGIDGVYMGEKRAHNTKEGHTRDGRACMARRAKGTPVS
jgi:hypothetical protein